MNYECVNYNYAINRNSVVFLVTHKKNFDFSKIATKSSSQVLKK